MKINKNLVIFITGAGSGFGLDSSIRFIALGCKVIMADI
jgi:NADP-dependent 3-hydroxy acid dehydrogenase YdfG